jgi:quercetin dioxygenase-like cupin family protein
MLVLDHAQQPVEVWREGVRTRMRVSIMNGAAQLCQFEQWCDAGKGAPSHLHAVEEILTVLHGEAEIWIEGELRHSRAGESVVVPAGRKHGFRNVGTETLHVLATLAAPIFEASFDDQKELSRRWVPA